jgi:DNA polymerase-3 subunit delta
LNVSRYDVFQLGDAMLAADRERTVRILRGLREEGTQVVAMMGALVWLLRGVVRIKQAESLGENLANVMQQAKIRRDRQTLVERALRRLSLRQLQAAMGKLAEIDKIAKGIAKGDAWLEISRLCFGLATIGNRAKSH